MIGGKFAALSWTASQRLALIVLLSGTLLYLVVRLIANPVYVSDPPPTTAPRVADVEDRIDPNDADWQTLAALPNIGEKRAKDIISFREAFVATHPGQAAFTKPEDLEAIRGIGPATVSQIRENLIFSIQKSPATVPTTRR